MPRWGLVLLAGAVLCLGVLFVGGPDPETQSRSLVGDLTPSTDPPVPPIAPVSLRPATTTLTGPVITRWVAPRPTRKTTVRPTPTPATSRAPATSSQRPSTTPAPTTPAPLYANCAAVRAAGAAPLLIGQPGYSLKLDGDGDGVACEEN